MVKEVVSATDFDGELNKAGGKLVVVDFHATWCGPCKVIRPVFESLASQNPGAVFLKVDVDQVQTVAQRYSVRAMPTFLFIKDRKVIETLQGANPSRLQALVKQHAAGSSSSFSGSGQTLSGSSAAASGPRAGGGAGLANPIRGITEGHASLLHLVDASKSTALNERADHGLAQILGGNSKEAYLESDADEQIIIQLSFKQKVKISGLLLQTHASRLSSAPREVKIFVNRPNLDFEDAASEEPAQALDLGKADVASEGGDAAATTGPSAIPLRFVKFQSVTSISIAILANQGDEESTRIDALDVFGIASETTNMNDLQSMEAQGRLDRRFGDNGPPPSRTGLKGGSGRSSSTATSQSYFPTQPLRSPPATQGRPSAPPIARSGSRDEVPKRRRRSSSASAASYVESDTGSVRTAPPYLSTEEEEQLEADPTSPESFGGWHYLPLIIALAPPIGAVIGGRADAWSDAILLFLSSFWLYQFLRVPWELYYSSRTRRVLGPDLAEEGDEFYQDESRDADVSLDAADGSRHGESSPIGNGIGKSSGAQRFQDAEREHARQVAAAELRRAELASLLFCIISPLIGAYLLDWIRASMVDGGRYLNAFNLRLFTLAAGIKPWTHAIKLMRRRILHLQEDVHYPHSKVEGLNKRLRRLEADLAGIRKMIATKNDIRILRDVDAQLGRAVRRSEKKEEHLRISAEDKFNEVENRLEDLLREVAINAELIEEERRERERATNLRISLLDAVKFLLGAGVTLNVGSGQRHYLHDAPRSLPPAASFGIGMGSPPHEQPQPFGNGHPVSARHLPYGGAQQQLPHGLGGSPPRAQTSPTSASLKAQQQSGGARGSPPQQHGSPSLDSHMISRYYERNGVSQVSEPWWEHGLAFYLFLPLTVSSAAIRFAGAKVRGILEDSEEFSLKKQQQQQQQRSHYAPIGPAPASHQPQSHGQTSKSRPGGAAQLSSSVHLAAPKLMKPSMGGARARRAE